MQLADMSWTDVRDADVSVALFPIGAIEQHGPHAPLRTDLIIAEEMAAEAARRTDALYLPPVNVGVSENHRHFDGSIYVSEETMRRIVVETLESLARHGVEKTVIVNGHGGNTDAINEACRRLYRDGVAFATEWLWARAIGVMDTVDHGGELETALVMHLDESLVSEPREGSDAPHGIEEHGASVGGYDTIDFTERGCFGEPETATAETGGRVFEESVSELVALVEYLRETDVGTRDAVDPSDVE